MKEVLLENWMMIIGISFPFVIFAIGGIMRAYERKKYGEDTKVEEKDVLGTIGSVMGATVYRDNLPSSVVGAKPTGHVMKLDFSYDEEAEKEYEEKYGKYL